MSLCVTRTVKLTTARQTVADTSPAGLSEPINTVILGTSDAAVLVNSAENGGLVNYFKYVSQTTRRRMECSRSNRGMPPALSGSRMNVSGNTKAITKVQI